MQQHFNTPQPRPTDPARGERTEAMLEQEIAELEQQLCERFYYLGKDLFEAASDHIDGINMLVDVLIEKRLELVRQKGQRICEHCLTPNEAENTYCGHCGQKLDLEDPA